MRVFGTDACTCGHEAFLPASEAYPCKVHCFDNAPEEVRAALCPGCGERDDRDCRCTDEAYERRAPGLQPSGDC